MKPSLHWHSQLNKTSMTHEMTQSWIALFRSVEYSYFWFWGFGSYVPATSISPPQIMISQKKQCKGRRPWLVSFPWSINTGGKGYEEYLPFLAGVPVGEQVVDGYKGCHFLLSVVGKKLLSRLEFSPIFIYTPSVLIYISTSELSGMKDHPGTALYWWTVEIHLSF